MRHQKAALSKQREDCMKKATILKKELETLKEQRNELHNDPKRSPSPDTKRFLKENTKLQVWSCTVKMALIDSFTPIALDINYFLIMFAYQP